MSSTERSSAGAIWTRFAKLAGPAALGLPIVLAGVAISLGGPSTSATKAGAAGPERQPWSALQTANAQGAARGKGAITTRAQLASALAGARDGDVLALAPGNYGPLVINERRFGRAVSLTSADPRSPATFSTIRILNSQQISLRDIDVRFVPDAKTVQSDSAVFVKGSTAISLIRSRIVGGMAVSGMPESTEAGKLDRTGNVIGRPTARAITISTSQDVRLSQNDVSVFHMGIVLDRVTGVRLDQNVVHDLRTTPLAGRQLSDVRIEGNHFHSFRPWRFGGAGDHGDLIHFYTMPGSPPSRGIVIRSNWLDQGAGDPLLGIYLDDNKAGIGFVDVSIENNLIVNGNHQGIRLENVRGLVANNTLVLPKGGELKKAPQILALQNSDVTVTRNIVAKVSTYPDSKTKEQENLLVARGKGGASYESVFVDPSAASAGPRQFGLRKPKGGQGVGADMSLIAAQLQARSNGPAGRAPDAN